MRKYWIAFAGVIIVSFAVLGWIGTRIYQQAPPIPERVTTATGETLLTRADIEAGQVPELVIINKVDAVKPQAVIAQLAAASSLGATEYFPVSARTGRGVPELVERLASLLPEGPSIATISPR